MLYKLGVSAEMVRAGEELRGGKRRSEGTDQKEALIGPAKAVGGRGGEAFKLETRERAPYMQIDAVD